MNRSLQIGHWILTTQMTFGSRARHARLTANARCFTRTSRLEAPTPMPTSRKYARLSSVNRTRSPAVYFGWDLRSREPNAGRDGGAMTAGACGRNFTKLWGEAMFLVGQRAGDPTSGSGPTQNASRNAFWDPKDSSEQTKKECLRMKIRNFNVFVSTYEYDSGLRLAIAWRTTRGRARSSLRGAEVHKRHGNCVMITTSAKGGERRWPSTRQKFARR